MNILLVDDDQVDRAMVKRVISKSQLAVNVVEAETVDDGLIAFKQQQFDLVLLDYRMPRRDGIEMVIELRSLYSQSQAAILVMSHVEDERISINCIKEGAQGFLLKSEITVSKMRSAILHAQIRHELESKLFQSHKNAKLLAETDVLTGVANRYVFDEKLQNSISHYSPETGSVAVFNLDVDRFKYINDTYGHNVGDAFLQKATKRLKKKLAKNELLARLGGDEFGVIVNHVNDIKYINHLAIKLTKCFDKGFNIGGNSILASVSIGISVYPENCKDATELFKQSELAMYRSKKLGRNQTCFFEDDMQRNFINRMELEQQLDKAITEEEFVLCYQPVVVYQESNRTFKLHGFEALIRWNYKNELKFPDYFISVAEDSGQIIPIGYWIFEQAINCIKEWNVRCGDKLKMAVNVSTVQLSEPNLAKKVGAILEANQLDGKVLEIEVTETALIKDTGHMRENLSQLKKLGCAILLDDFGTGFSSISHLQHFPITAIKIDKSLMVDTHDNQKNFQLVKGLFHLANDMGLDVVAEGVEKQQDLNICHQIGISKYQGFYFSRPLYQSDVESQYIANIEKNINPL